MIKRYKEHELAKYILDNMITENNEWCKSSDVEKLEDKVDKVLKWVKAYPIEIFPEPDLKKAQKILKENGMTIDAISASNFRFVLNRVKEILEK